MKKNIFSKLIYIVLALFLGISSCSSPLLVETNPAPVSTDVSVDSTRALPSTVDDGVMLHAYNWRFSDIKAALPQIAAAGYKSVQTSPVQGTKATGQWWLLYQPTNFAIGNAQLGSQSDFAALCAAANTYGIKIIVDAVLNHVADNGTSGQWANEVESYLKRSDWYHNQGTIGNYTDRRQLTQGNLGNLPDLATQRSDVQQVILGFLNSAVDSGAGGFRFDAAKHIETNAGLDAGQAWAGGFWDNVLGGLHNRANLYLYGEVIQDTGDNLSAYTNLFDVTAHGYIWTLSNAFNNGNWNGIQSVNGVTPSKALVYVENHDTYEHNESTSFSFWKRKAMWAVITARSGMTPLFLDRPGVDEWNEGDIAALNNFRNAMVGQSEYLRFPTNPVVVIERGTLGAVIINNGGATYLNTATNVAAGSYSNKGLASANLTSSGGQLTGNIPAYSVVIIYGGSAPTPPATPTGFTATASGSSQINLAWNASAGATSYNILRSSTSTGTYTSVGTATGTTFPNTGLNASTAYYYRVTASNSAGTSAQSTTANATTTAAGTGLKVHFKVNSVANWSNVNVYYWASNGSPIGNTWPGQAAVSEGSSWFGFTIPGSSSSNIIFNNGSVQTVDLNRTTEGWFVPTGNSSGKITGVWYASNPDGAVTTTTIKVTYNVGTGNTLSVRGSLAPLSWTLGAPATWTTGNVWVYTTTAIPAGTSFEFKALINDNRWSDGANFTGTGGSTMNVTPTFNGNFYDTMDTMSTNWAVSGGTTTKKWYQGTGVAQANATSTISYLTQNFAMNKTGIAVTLAFKYKVTGLDTGEYLKVQVLKGTTWTNLATYTGTQDWINKSIDITAYQSTAMKLRFLSFMNGADEYVYVDNVTVSTR